MSSLVPATVKLADLPHWLGGGWRMYGRCRGVSSSYGAIFAVLGFLQFYGVVRAGFSPLMVALTGGFMLVGPALLCGFFHLADEVEAGNRARFSHVIRGFRRSPAGLWVVALLEMFLFMIWLTDAGVAYGMYFGITPHMGLPEFAAGLAGEGETWSYLLFSGLMGTILALIIFASSAFAVPLLFYRRANLAGAVVASVRTVFGSFVPMLAWAALVAVGMFAATLLLPLFPVVFPVLAHASREAYRQAFPDR